MFNLNNSTEAWRKQMLAAGIKSPVPLEELESHLREEIEQQMQLGLSEQKAFEIAVQTIGQPNTLKLEFGKIKKMTLQTYTSTSGLERYPQSQRFAVWRAAHKRLKRDDRQYCKRHHFYLAVTICLACVSFSALFIVGSIGVALDLVLSQGCVAIIVWLAFWQQHFMNQRIGLYLQSSHNA